MDPACVYGDEHCWLGTWKNVVISIWTGHVTAERIERSFRCTRNVLADYPDGLGSFVVVAQGAVPRVGAAEREKYAEFSRTYGPRVRGNAQVLEGSGFVLVTLRAVLAGVSLLARAPTKTFDRMAPAAEWLTPRCGDGFVSDQLMRAVTGARMDWDGKWKPRSARVS